MLGAEVVVVVWCRESTVSQPQHIFDAVPLTLAVSSSDAGGRQQAFQKKRQRAALLHRTMASYNVPGLAGPLTYS